MARLQAARETLVRLLELVATVGVGEEIGEVREQVQVVIKTVCHDFRRALIVTAMPFGLQAVTLGIAASGVIPRTEERNQAVIHGALRHLIARIPFAVIAARGDAETVGIITTAIGENAIELLIIVGILPRPIVMIKFKPIKQVALPDLR